MDRFTAKLVFEYRTNNRKVLKKMHLCEERYVHFCAVSTKSAFRKAWRLGKQGELKYKNDKGMNVTLVFLGIAEIRNLTIECHKTEVWYDIVRRARIGKLKRLR